MLRKTKIAPIVWGLLVNGLIVGLIVLMYCLKR
jgi:hypothetical protein